MYLVHPYTWEKLKEGGEKPDSVKVKEHNENMIKEKILADNEKNKQWSEFSNRFVPIIKRGREPSPSSSPPPSPPPSSQPPKEETVLDTINNNIAYNYRAKALRFYNLLKDVKGVDITPESISVAGKPVMGSTSFNIGQLIRGNKFLSFDLSPLLQVISEHSNLKPLIANQQAKKYLENISPGILSPIHSTPMQRPKSFASSRDSSTFYDPDSTLNRSIASPDKTKDKKGGKKRKRLIWKSLFDTYG